MFVPKAKGLFAALAAALGCLLQLAADQPKFEYHDAFEKPFEFSGILWRGPNGELRRLPPEITAKDVAPHTANFHSYHTSGGEVRFCTDSNVIAIRAEVYKISEPMHMTRNGAAGFALFMEPGTEKERFLRSTSPSNAEMRRGDPAQPRKIDFTFKFKKEPGMNCFSFYLPLYAGVKKFEIGLPEGAKLAPPPPRRIALPICFYGSSITQGCSASHPGSMYPTLLCRAVGAPQINLGFSAGARGESCVAEAIAKLKLSALVIDYDHNARSKQHLQNTHEKFFRIIREAQPELPIIIVSGPMDPNSPTARERRDIIKATYDHARAAGDKHVYFVDGLTFFGNIPQRNCAVDNTHPSDLGFYLMFKKILPTLREALGE